MKAAMITDYGGSDRLMVVNYAQAPSPKPGQVLVEVHAASINPIDYKIREGYLKETAPLRFPAVLGGDFSGVVTRLGEGVTEFKIGDPVYGQAILLNGGSGAFAEFVAANVANTCLKPEKADFLASAALPLAGASALQGIEDHIQLDKSQKILIHGGAGGIGSIAVQLAKSIGAHVAATAKAEDLDFVRELGADEVMDYRKQAFEEIVRDYDAVFDTAGGKTAVKSVKVLKRGGMLVSMTGLPDQALVKQYGIAAIGQRTATDAPRLRRLVELVDKGIIRPIIGKVFPLDRIRDAFDHAERNHPRGKVVIQIR